MLDDHCEPQVMFYEVISRVLKLYSKHSTGMFLFSKHSSPCLKLNYDSSAALKSQVSSVSSESSFWAVKSQSAYLWFVSDLIPSLPSLHLLEASAPNVSDNLDEKYDVLNSPHTRRTFITFTKNPQWEQVMVWNGPSSSLTLSAESKQARMFVILLTAQEPGRVILGMLIDSRGKACLCLLTQDKCTNTVESSQLMHGE